MKTIYLGLILLMIISCTKENNEIIVNVDEFSVVVDENPLEDQLLGSLIAFTNKGDLKYSIISQIPNGALKIDSVSGEIYVNNSRLFDYESYPSIKGIARVTNKYICEETNITITLKNYILDSIVAGDTISPYISINKFIFAYYEGQHYYYYDINHDGIDDIKFTYDFQFANNRNNYLGVMLLHEDIEIARSLDTKNDIINQLPLYDVNDWYGSYAFNAANVEWPESFILYQTIDNSFDWINDSFYFETHSSSDALGAYMEFYSIKDDEYIGIRIKTETGYLYGWLSYPHLWFWGEDYFIIALNVE